MEVQQAHLMRGADGVDGIDFLCVPVFCMWTDFIHGELVSQITQHLLHLVELEVDHALRTGRPDLMLVNAQAAKMMPFRCRASNTRKIRYSEMSMAPSRRRKR